MRSWMLPILTAALLGVSGTFAATMPSLGGPTGIITLPSADIAPMDQWQTAVTLRTFDVETMYDPSSTVLVNGGSMYGLDDSASVWAFNFLWGVADDAEVWAAYSRATGQEDGEILEVGGKYRIHSDMFGPTGTFANTRLAVGGSVGRWADSFLVTAADSVGMYGGGASGIQTLGDIEFARGYVVATKQIYPYGDMGDWQWVTHRGNRVIASGGLLFQWIDSDLMGDETSTTPFIAGELLFGEALALNLEYRWNKNIFGGDDLDDDSLFSASLRRTFGSNTHLELGVTNASPLGIVLPEDILPGDDLEFFIRFGYDAEMSAPIF